MKKATRRKTLRSKQRMSGDENEGEVKPEDEEWTVPSPHKSQLHPMRVSGGMSLACKHLHSRIDFLPFFN